MLQARPVTVLTPRDPRDKELRGTSVQLPVWLVTRLDEIAESDGYSRNEVVIHFLKWALEQYETEKKGGKR